MTAPTGFLEADWPAPPGIHAGTTLRTGGVSAPPFDSFNLGDRAGDHPQAVAANRARLIETLALPAEPAWLYQVHRTRVADADEMVEGEADASTGTRSNTVCAVLTADCLPVLFCDARATCWGVAHAGWRGLASGILEATVARLPAEPRDLLAWLGPAIGPAAFEVGQGVYDAFCRTRPEDAAAFTSGRASAKYYADIYTLARARLARAGVRQVYGGGLCTVSDTERFYSYRREPSTGRMASLVWLAA